MADEISDERWFQEKLGFNRETLRNSPQFIEQDYRGVNPREILRKVRREIQDITRKGRFKFAIKKDPIHVSREDIGERSGFVRGGLFAEHKRPEHEGGGLSYKPYFLHGIGVLVFGIFLMIIGLVAKSLLSILGMGLIGLGFYLSRHEEYETFPIIILTKLRNLLLGEVKEKTIEKEDTTTREIEGNVTGSFSADSHINLYDSQKYRSLLEDRVRNAGRFVNEMEKVRNEIFKEIYLENREMIEEPLLPEEVQKKNFAELKNELEKIFPSEQIAAWVSDKLVDKGIVIEEVRSSLEEDLQAAMSEIKKLSSSIEDYAERT